MYTFGYALVHAPVQWHLIPRTSFDMLVSSLADHAPDGKILGSIVKLNDIQLVGNLYQSVYWDPLKY